MIDVRCPKCGKRAHLKRYARPAGILIGGATGWINGWQAAAQTAQLALRCAGPYGAIAGQIAGALFSAAIVAFAGNYTGGLIDKEIIARYECPGCGHKFRQ
jgi:predicted RNA-binding Zn-ribbon protein involved in translation (DUF1610 family)